LRLVDPVVDRALLADELLHRALVLDALVLVAAPLREPVAGDPDPREGVGHPFRRELDREPPLIARAQATCDPQAVDPLREQGPERGERLVDDGVRAGDLLPKALRGLDTRRVR